MSDGFATGLGIGIGILATSLLLPLIPLLLVGGGIYVLNKIFPEENEECENGQKVK